MTYVIKDKPQKFFNKVAVAVYKQGARSYDQGSGNCCYRYTTTRGNTLKCAMGMAIPDEVYTPDMETKTVYTLVDKLKAIDFEIPETQNVATRLQNIHDGLWANSGAAFRSCWKKKIGEYAKANGLSMSYFNNKTQKKGN